MTSELDLATYLAVSDLKASYFQHLDAKRWHCLRDVFSADARFEGFAFDATGGREDFIATVSAFLADVRSQHQGFMPRFRRLGGNKVRAVWGMHDYLTWEPGSRVYKGVEVPGMHGIRGWGYYEEEYSLTPDGWRISFSRLVRTRIDALVGELPVTPAYDVMGPDPDWLGVA